MTEINFDKALEKIAELAKNKPEGFLQKVCELLKQEIYHYDWVGFYILDPQKGELVLGPFAGKPTQHTHIAVGKGICGQVAANSTAMIVQDVTQVENYISCGIDVQSEIVVPIIKNGIFIAEIDIDSHSPAPFTNDDLKFLEAVCSLVTDCF